LCAGVDEDAIAGPIKWDVKSIERHLFGAGEALFQTGWFMESITTQVLVVFAIRTRRPIFRSRPHVFLAAMALGVIAVAIALPLLPVRRWLGFVAPPPLFFVFLIGATSAYLAIVEINKRIVCRITVERSS
jgi:Mg2+-importing ATPase